MQLLLLLVFISISTFGQEQDFEFEDYFEDKIMRVDYTHTGDEVLEIIGLDKISVYGEWFSSKNKLLDPFNNGQYYIKVYDYATEKLIFSKGYNSYFYEYASSSAGMEGTLKTYYETALIPAPKKKIIFEIERRISKNKMGGLFREIIDPKSVSILKETPKDHSAEIINAHISGSPKDNIDLVILSEGYTKSEKSEFRNDLTEIIEVFFDYEPFKTHKNKFNIYGIFKPSIESGVDEPRAGIFRSTPMDFTFNSLGSERYLLTENYFSVVDLASLVPFESIVVMVNSKRYGGGGIYNYFSVFTSGNQWRNYLFLHEFGHSFAGLADEYYTSTTAYNDFYPKGEEPPEPNITRLLDWTKLKWIDFVDDTTRIPTPWEKGIYDEIDYNWQQRRAALNEKIAELKRNNAPKFEIEKAEKLYAQEDLAHSIKIDSILSESKYYNVVGAYEGAGYSSMGMFRPEVDCIMFSKGEKPFCEVCKSAIEKVILHYSNPKGKDD